MVTFKKVVEVKNNDIMTSLFVGIRRGFFMNQ